MVKFIARSLQLKLILGITIILALSIFTWQYLESRAFKQAIYQNLINSCENMVEVIGKIWEEHMLTHKIPEAKKEIETVGRVEGVKLIYFVNPKGKVRFSSDLKLVGKPYAEDKIQQIEKTDKPYFSRVDNIFSSLTPMKNKPECQHCHGKLPTVGYIGLDLDVKKEIDFMSQLYRTRLRKIFILTPIFYLLIIFTISLFLQINIHQPLAIIRGGLNKVKEGIFGEKITTKSIDEIGELTNSFNLMSATLKETSEELVRSARMSTLGHLAAGISEELQKPLNSIQKIFDLLKKKLGERSVDLGTLFNDLERNFYLAQRTITNLIQFAGPPRLCGVKPTNINLSLEEAILQAEKENLLGKIKINKKFTAQLPILELDQARINQVFYNLILNACEAMPNGGELILATAVKDNNLQVEISDTGIGIPEEKIKDIFNPFFTTKTKSLGLGLMIVKENLEKHKAKIEVESFPGRWTTFRIKFRFE